jgi:transcriptional regulator GlxA family with amidase domain
MHAVFVLALDGVLAFDLSTPIEVFGRARLPDGRAAYRVRVCAPADEVDAGVFAVRAPCGLGALDEADTIVVPGLADPTAPIPENVLDALRAAAEGGARIASICVGAFTLAASGLLDGLRATTHWAAAGELSRLYPEVEVDADVLFVDNGRILTPRPAAPPGSIYACT